MGKWNRGVSIIGAAYTQFGNVLETPALKGMTYQDLVSWAALEALENAGITTKDVDSLLVANFQSETIKAHSLNTVIAEWLGLKTKPSITYETACASGATGLRLGGSLIASGIDDIVLLVGTEIFNSISDDDLTEYRKQPAVRVPLDPNLWLDYVSYGFDQAYVLPVGFDVSASMYAFPIESYAKKYGLTPEQLDDALNATAINNRRNAAKNPRAWRREEFSVEAKKAGFASEQEYLKSKYNPFVSWPLRASQMAVMADGAAALVLCPADQAKKYTKTPVDVVGVGHGAGYYYEPDSINLSAEMAAFDQAYKMSGINPKDIEYLGLHDCCTHTHITVSEMAGYFAPGEAWKAVLEGRTAYDGDKPINTLGGCTSMGNVGPTSGIAEIGEAVMQMRGECGDRQMNHPPKLAVCHALGGGPNYGVSVLEKRD